MELTVELETEALRKAESLAAERGQSLGKVLGDAILGQSSHEIVTNADGWPLIQTRGPITTEEIKAMIAEDETWEITRGDPHHPFHKPIVTMDEQGFPQVEIGRPLTLQEVRAAVEEE